jgi:OOP family OmpA-OmpF porin
MYSVSLVMPLGHRLSQKTRAIIRDTPEPIVLEREREVIVENPPSKKITLSADSLFGFDKYQLSQKGKDSLDQMILQLNRTEIDSILVAGYADRVGSHEYNLKLSEQRVQAVKNYLVEKMNISKEIITAAGHDGDNPVTRLGECKGVRASPALIACLQPDRRVVVEVIGVKEGI